MKIEDFLKRFRYRKGLPNLFGRDIRKSAEGDCTSFAWSVLLILEDGFLGALKAQITGKAKIWRVKSSVNGLLPRHVALCVNGVFWADGEGPAWIDSTYPKKWRRSPSPHKLMWPLWYEKAAVLVALAVAAKVWGLW